MRDLIVSHLHRFIYIRTRKTASTSLEISLSRVCGDRDIITGFCDRDEELRRQHGGRARQNLEGRGGLIPYNHMSAAEVRDYVGEEVWENYFVFTVERDPLEKVVSLYYHRYKKAPRPTLQSFIDSGEAKDAWNWPLYSIADRLAMDYVGNYARLLDAVSQIELRIGQELQPLTLAKNQFRDDRRRATEILTCSQIETVLDQFVGEPLPFGSTAGIEVERR